MPDQLEEMFAELRADTVMRIRVPGAAAARRTVRRRRIAASTVGVTGLAVVAGGVVLSGVIPVRQEAPAMSRAVDSQQRAEQSLAYYGGIPALEERTGQLDDPTTISVPNVPVGSYTVIFSCAEAGSVIVNIRYNRASTGGVARCARAATPLTFDVTMPATGTIDVVLTGNSEAAYALRVVSTAEMAQQPPPSKASVANAGKAGKLLAPFIGTADLQRVTTERDMALVNGPLAKGDWLVHYACAGAGTITVAISYAPTDGSAEQSAAEGRLECTAAGKIGAESRIKLAAESVVHLRAFADSSAADEAGWAYFLAKT